jgi:hypothetical protein
MEFITWEPTWTGQKGLFAMLEGMVNRLMAQDPTDPAPFATIKQFAHRHQVSTRTIRNWIKLGMPSYKNGRIVRIVVEFADRWVIAGGPNKRQRPKPTRRA